MVVPKLILFIEEETKAGEANLLSKSFAYVFTVSEKNLIKQPNNFR